MNNAWPRHVANVACHHNPTRAGRRGPWAGCDAHDYSHVIIRNPPRPQCLLASVFCVSRIVSESERRASIGADNYLGFLTLSSRLECVYVETMMVATSPVTHPTFSCHSPGGVIKSA